MRDKGRCIMVNQTHAMTRVAISVFLAVLGGATVAVRANGGIVRSKAENTGLTQSILDKMIENRNKVENFKCINEKFVSYPEDILKNVPGHKIYRSQEEQEDARKRLYRYHIDHLALDNKGTGRVTIISEEADAKGNRTGNRIRKITTTWVRSLQ